MLVKRPYVLLRGLAAIALLAPAAAPPAQAQANLVQNGSFEAATTLDASLPNGSTAIPFWVVTGPGSQNVAVVKNGDYGMTTPYGRQLVDLTGYSDSAPYAGVTQTLSTVKGKTYLFSMCLGLGQDNSNYYGPVAASATIGDVSQTFTFTAPARSSGNLWQSFGFAFVASGTSSPLIIKGALSTGGHYIGLDNVSVSAAPVAAAPEPSEWAAVGFTVLVLAGLMLKAHRRSGNVA